MAAGQIATLADLEAPISTHLQLDWQHSALVRRLTAYP